MFHPNNWLMNESLDFYLSTNTFSNPMFDDNQLGLNNELQENKTNEEQANLEEQYLQQADNQESRDAEKKQESTGNKRLHEQQEKWSSFCDNLVFSIKSKMYVLELSFKSRLRQFRRYASSHLPWWIISAASSSNNNNSSSNNGAGVIGERKHRTARVGGEYFMNYSSPLSPLESGLGGIGVNRRRIASGNVSGVAAGGGAAAAFDLMSDESFWKDIEPNSRDSLSKQQEIILSRLELVVQAKRSNQLRLQQLQEEFGDKLFNMYGGGFGFGFGYTGSSVALGNNNAGSYNPAGVRFIRTTPMESHCREAAKASSGATNTCSSSAPLMNQQRNAVQSFAACMARGSNSKVCIVCYSNPANIVTLPCKHHDICSDCFIEIIYLSVKQSQYPLKCVLCRQKIERIKCSRGLLLGVPPS